MPEVLKPAADGDLGSEPWIYKLRHYYDYYYDDYSPRP